MYVCVFVCISVCVGISICLTMLAGFDCFGLRPLLDLCQNEMNEIHQYIEQA